MNARARRMAGLGITLIALAGGCQLDPFGSEAPSARAEPPATRAAPVAAKADGQPAQGAAPVGSAAAAQTEPVTRAPARMVVGEASASDVRWPDLGELRLSSAPTAPRAARGEGEAAPVTMAAGPSRATPLPPAGTPAVVPAGRASAATATANKAVSVRTAAGSDLESPVPVIAETSTSPVVAMGGLRAGGSDAPGEAGEAVHRKLAQQAKDNPKDIAAQLDYQLLQFVRGEAVPQLDNIASLSAEDREVLAAILDGLSNFRNAARADTNMLLSQKVRPILDMADRLRSQSELAIPTLALCTEVKGYGSYDPIEPARFVAGQEVRAVIYCEVANFTSRNNERKLWETRLTQQAVLYTESGLSVWQDKSKTITDLSRNRRHDFFIAKLVRLPANLTIGRYLLKVSVVDEQASRVAEAMVPMQIVAQ